MSILEYFQRTSNSEEPDPNGSLSTSVPSKAIAAANIEIQKLRDARASRKRGFYNTYTAKDRAAIGRYAVQHGPSAAARVFSRKLGKRIHESTVRIFKKLYEEEVSKRRKAGDDDVHIKELNTRKQGRPLEIGEKKDLMVQKYILALREKGCVIDTSIVISATRGIMKSLQRSQLQEYGGPVKLRPSWARSLLKRMKFTRRKGTTKASLPVSEFKEKKKQFLEDVIDVVDMEEIPSELILNWDQTGVNLVPTNSWTMAQKGSKRVEIKSTDDKRQITCVFCVSLVGDFLPLQVIYKGKTDRCHPPFDFPSDWLVSHSPNHWSNEDTMINYIEQVIVPYVVRTRELLELEDDQPALAIFDHFKGQLTENVNLILEENNIHSVLVPAGCTDRLQPLDISVNKSAKSFLKREFQNWYCEQISEQLLQEESDADNIEPVDLSTARMKCLGAQWLLKMSEYLSNSPDIIVNGFLASGITPSLSCGLPVLEEHKTQESEDDSSGNESSSSDEL